MVAKRTGDSEPIDTSKEHAPTEEIKHRSGGPGKSARSGDNTGNAPSQEQAGPGHDHKGGESGPIREGREGPLPDGRRNEPPPR